MCDSFFLDVRFFYKKLIKWLIILFSVAGTFYADSRTGMAAIVFSIIIASFFYVRKRVLKLGIVLLLGLAGFLLILSEPRIPFETQQDRIDRIKGALEIVAQNPFGVGWAEQRLFPHNWPIMVLLTGGVISFTAVVIYHVWLLRLLWKIKKLGLNTVSSLGIVLATITTSSYSEQVFLEAHAILIAMFLYRVFINYTSDLKIYRINKAEKSA